MHRHAIIALPLCRWDAVHLTVQKRMFHRIDCVVYEAVTVGVEAENQERGCGKRLSASKTKQWGYCG